MKSGKKPIAIHIVTIKASIYLIPYSCEDVKEHCALFNSVHAGGMKLTVMRVSKNQCKKK
jgi:hypothetical protein